jgi:hypothetical protein
MRKFVAKHAAATTGTLSCFDRLLFKGHLSLGYPHGMEDFLNHQGVLFKQLKPFVLRQAERLRTHSRIRSVNRVADAAGRMRYGSTSEWRSRASSASRKGLAASRS